MANLPAIKIIMLTAITATLSINNYAEEKPPKPCPQQRPQVCTMNYDPVCAADKAGSKKTYSNSCSACSQKAVVSYTEDPCEVSDAVK